jgi:demethylmenaquinone methyltransferase/2-methoxy-6-polyprenyl-1,4-benzoquinol methylase
MIGQKAVWVEKQKRKKHLSNPAGGEETAYFGYQRISAGKKTDKVLQHFNSVAPYYDFMNTLLSFGIHHIWKRTAVKMLELSRFWPPGTSEIQVASPSTISIGP